MAIGNVLKNGTKRIKSEIGRITNPKQHGFNNTKDQIRQRMADRKSGGGSGYKDAFPKQKKKDFWNNTTDSDYQQVSTKQRLKNKDSNTRSGYKDAFPKQKKKDFWSNTTDESLKNVVPRKGLESRINREGTPLRKSRREGVRKEIQRRGASLNTLDFEVPESAVGSLTGALGTGYRSAVKNLGEQGNLKRAGIGMAQSSAASAAGHGGLAAIQGEDPWEAAKTGAIRGAMIGGGYQGLKAATHANTGSLRGNLKHIGSTSKDTYRAHTAKGNAALRKSGVSPQLARVLEQGKRVENSSGIFGF